MGFGCARDTLLCMSLGKPVLAMQCTILASDPYFADGRSEVTSIAHRVWFMEHAVCSSRCAFIFRQETKGAKTQRELKGQGEAF